MTYWKIIRVLTTDTCNFNCAFCHNEGQQIKSTGTFLSLEQFSKIILALKDRPLREIQFSGGEPFLNNDTIKMIEWADENTSYEIGCATNMSLLDESKIRRLSKTRVTLNIQFPSTKNQEYNKITNSEESTNILDKLLLLQKLRVEFKLNFVWMKEDLPPLSDMLDFCIEKKFSLKILPYISPRTIKLNNYRNLAVEHIGTRLGQPQKKGGGALRWTITNKNDSFVIKYVDSPCFDNDFVKCKDYAEIRLLPNLALQHCLLKPSKLNINKDELNSVEAISEKVDTLWKTFTNC